MIAFRVLLIVLFVGLTAYTVPVIARDGINFFPFYIRDVGAVHWPGQFDVDFTTFLILSATWTAWRARFTASGLGLAIVALFMGGIFLLPFLLYLSIKHRGDAAAILLGDQRERTS